jgi:DNA helicase HerA-like ATPase
MMNLEDTEPGDQSKFRLIGRSVLSYRFIVPHDRTLYVGEIVKVTDQIKGRCFYAKVADLHHESNFTDERWDTRPFSEHFYRLGDDVFIGVDAIPLGYVDDGGVFRKPRTLPSKFSPVDIPDVRDLNFLTQVMGDIEVGLMKSGQDVIRDVQVRIHSDVLPQHMGVFATTGMGKSNFMKVFCASCMKERQFGLLMVDPHGEYLHGKGRSQDGRQLRGLIHVENARDGLAVFTTRPEDQRRRYQAHALTLEYNDFRIGDLSLLYDLSYPQKDIIEALGDYNGSDIIGFFENLDPEAFTPDTYRDLHGRDREMAFRLRTSNPGPLRVIKRRLANLVQGNRRFFRDRGSSLSEILEYLHQNRVVLIDIPRMSERSELFVLSIITRVILENHKETSEKFGIEEDQDEPPRVLITIEEAQRVLGTGGSSTQVFRECAMEGRKFGVGLCVITQQPKNIDPRVLAQINTFVVMGLGDKGDRDMIAGSAKQDLTRMDTEIQTLERGEAIISSLLIPFPVSTKIHLFEDYVKELEAWKKKDIREGLERGF